MNTKLLLFLLVALCATSGFAQKKKKKTNATIETYQDSLYNGLKYRNIGPFRGGRSTASSGVVGDPLTYYFGAAGGGVWKTEDAGLNWRNITDKFLKATSIGAIAVAESDPNVIYVGTGEACVRGVMTSHGDGVYKSTDAGKTWQHIGLDKTLHISRIRIHPKDPNVVYVAAQGSAYGPMPDRGIYKSVNGGADWEKVHFVNDISGANDLSMDKNNPRILYASFWDSQRQPWYIRSGGEGSGIWKTTDSGKTWKKINKGLPEKMGKIGVTVSRANSERLYAVVEADKGGLYRSDDSGKTWRQMSSERILRARSWYYMHIFADPVNEDLVYVLNSPFLKSVDGGKSFAPIFTPHVDNHDLWINPDNPANMINSNDGGANISFNAGKSWSTQKNQPTAQFYRINADNRFPYWLYAGQQDNSTLAIPSASGGVGIEWQDWVAGVGGGEAAHIAFDKNDPKYLYSSNIVGFIDEHNQTTRKNKSIQPYPIFALGEPSDAIKYRYNWNPPVIVSQHNPKVIYYGSQLVHKSENRAQRWQDISPDLTRNDTAHLGIMGGPFTNEGAGGEIYHTLMTLSESPHDANVLWAGADDGLLHLTTDGGSNWRNVSPGPEGIVNSIEVSPHDPQTVYVTLMRYKFNDFKPYVYKTTNNGGTWELRNNGIPDGAYARAVREDPKRKGLLYAGTERGVYVSFDGAQSWKPFQQNMPMVPITDLMVHQNDLLVATHGRAFWILDDLTPLHQLNSNLVSNPYILYQPRKAVLTKGFNVPNLPEVGTNPFFGAEIKYYLSGLNPKDSLELKLEILDGETVIRTFSSKEKSPLKSATMVKGMNVLKWDLTVEPIKASKGVLLAMETGVMPGYHVGPGTYTVQMTIGEYVKHQTMEVVKDPRDEASTEAIQAKTAIVKDMYSKIMDLYQTVGEMQEVREQVNTMSERMSGDEEISEKGKQIKESIDGVEGEMISPKQKTFQDIINYRNQLDQHMHFLMQTIDGNDPPITQGEKDLLKELMDRYNGVMEKAGKIMKEDIQEFNTLLKNKGVEYVAPKEIKDKKEEEKEDNSM